MRSGRGFKGETLSRGFLLFSFGLCVCAVTLGGSLCLVLPFDPISLVLAQRNGVEPPKKSAFYPGGSTIRVSASASVVVTHLRPTWGGGGWLTGQSQLDAVGGDVGASSSWERRAGPNISRGGTQKRVSLGLHPVSLRKSKEMGWNWQLGPTASDQQNGAHVTAQMRCRLVFALYMCADTLGGGRLFPLPTEIFKDFRGFSAFIVYYRVRGGAAWASAR